MRSQSPWAQRTARLSLPGFCRHLALASAAIAAVTSPALAHKHETAAPVTIERQGSFTVGGTVIGDPDKATLACDHGFVEYQIPVKARKTALMLWHSSSAQVWQNRWDGGEGFQTIFLRRNFPVYLWDGPRVGRANWGCEEYPYKPVPGRDQGNFIAWRFGPEYQSWYEGVQFPTGDAEAWNQATRARYDEFDTVENAVLQADAAAKAVDRIGPTVLVTNSAGGLRALATAIKSDNVKAIVAYENPGFVYPLPENGEEQIPAGLYGPIYVPKEDFLKLTRIPIQFVWGDNISTSKIWAPALARCREYVDLINRHGGKAELLVLPDKGIYGNTHIPFADLNNVAVADQLSLFLKEKGLDQ
ncbi:MAG: alpha/beta fold hydrolase [Blastomonas sp.]